MPLIINKKCCNNDKQQYKFDTLVTFGRKNINQISQTPLPEKEEYMVLCQVKTTSPHTQHNNKNFSVAPLDYDTKIITAYTEVTAKFQNDWYALVINHKLRVKSIINVDKANKYLIFYLKTEQV